MFDHFDIILEAFCSLLGSGRAPGSEFDIETFLRFLVAFGGLLGSLSWAQFLLFFKLKWIFDLFLGPSWVGLGSSLRDFWSDFWSSAVTSFWHRFSILFRCPTNLDFLILASTAAQFWHFRWGRCWHRFWPPKPSQNRAQAGPESSKTISKIFGKMNAIRQVKKTQKSTFGKFRSPKKGSAGKSGVCEKIPETGPWKWGGFP